MVHSPAFTFLSGYPLVFWFLAGLRLLVLRQSKPFWPLALVQQALPAIFFKAPPRFRGAVLFCGLRSSSSRWVAAATQTTIKNNSYNRTYLLG